MLPILALARPGLLIAALVLTLFVVQSVRLDRAQTAATVLTAQIATLEATLSARTAALAALQQASAAREKAAARATSLAAKRLAASEQHALALEAAPAPSSCEQAIEFLVSAAAQGGN